MSQAQLYNVLTFYAGLSPVVALILDRIRFRGKAWFLFFVAGYAVAGLLGLIVAPWPMGTVVSLYPFFSLGILASLTKKYGLENLSRALCLSLILGYMMTEIHEIPGFVRQYLGWFDNINALQSYLVWYSPLSHGFTALVGCLAIRLGRLQIRAETVGLFVLGLSVSVLVYPVTPMGAPTIWEYVKRIVWFSVTLIAFTRYGGLLRATEGLPGSGDLQGQGPDLSREGTVTGP